MADVEILEDTVEFLKRIRSGREGLGRFYFVVDPSRERAALVVTTAKVDRSGRQAVRHGVSLRRELRGAKYCRGNVRFGPDGVVLQVSGGTATVEVVRKFVGASQGKLVRRFLAVPYEGGDEDRLRKVVTKLARLVRESTVVEHEPSGLRVLDESSEDPEDDAPSSIPGLTVGELRQATAESAVFLLHELVVFEEEQDLIDDELAAIRELTSQGPVDSDEVLEHQMELARMGWVGEEITDSWADLPEVDRECVNMASNLRCMELQSEFVTRAKTYFGLLEGLPDTPTVREQLEADEGLMSRLYGLYSSLRGIQIQIEKLGISK